MRIGLLGTGMVGRALAARLAEVGHDVAVGTRDPAATRERAGGDGPAYGDWLAEHPGVRLVTLPEAGAHGEVLVNATNGLASVEALTGAGAGDRPGLVVVVDVANPLVINADGPPTLAVVNDDSLGERIQRAFPDAAVVKTLNTMNCAVMADPSRVPGDHTVYLSGEDAAAKDVVRTLLRDLGWDPANMIDLGGIVTARGAEMLLLHWVNLAGVLGTFDFNSHVVRAS